MIWDIDEASPIDVFGVSLEAFDPIRRQKKCHITYEDSSEALRVLGDKKDHVDDAVRRIQTAIESTYRFGQRYLALIRSWTLPNPSETQTWINSKLDGNQY